MLLCIFHNIMALNTNLTLENPSFFTNNIENCDRNPIKMDTKQAISALEIANEDDKRTELAKMFYCENISSFPLSDDQIIQIINSWEEKCTIESEISNGCFIPAPINLEKLMDFKPTKNRNILAIDIGGSTLKLGIVNIFTANITDPICKHVEIYKFNSDLNGLKTNAMSWSDWVALHVSEYIQEYPISVDSSVLTFPIQ